MVLLFRQWFALTISLMRPLPYRIRRSLIKHIYPDMLENYAFEATMERGVRFRGNIVNYIDRIVYFCGAHEKYMLHFLRDALPALKQARGEITFMDVGANAGNHTLYMASLVDNVYAFEPFGRVRNQLSDNIALNGFTNIRVFDFGLGETDADMPFYTGPEENLGSASFTEGHRPENTLLAMLKIRRGDAVMAEYQLSRIDIIKADVEGFEPQVMAGLTQTIRRDRPLIVVEVSATTKKAWPDMRALKNAFPEHYAFYAFAKGRKDSGRYRLEPYDDKKTYKIEDVICVPEEMRESIRLPAHHAIQ